MKKTLSILLITILIAVCMVGFQSFAADTTVQSVKSNNTSEKTAEAKLTKKLGTVSSDDVIYVEITWNGAPEQGDGIIATGADFEWDGESCSYVVKSGSEPTATGYVKYTVDIVNKSSCQIEWTVTYDDSLSSYFESELDSSSDTFAIMSAANVDGSGNPIDVNTFKADPEAGTPQSDTGNELKINVTGIKTGADVGELTNGSTQTLGTFTCTIGKHIHSYKSWSSDVEVHWHECEVCGAAFDSDTHSYDGWSKDGNNHWHECEVCGAKVDLAAHTDDNDDKECDVCSQGGIDCLAAGTKITMADGSVKNIEDIKEGDEVLTFNHEKGIYEGQKVYLAWASETPKKAFTLHFTNGIEISVIGDHDFFEKESLSYVAIFENTAEEFIGKHFFNAADGRYEELLSVTYGQEPVDYYEIYTEYNANCIAEGMINVAYDSSEMLNIYSFNEDLTIDHDQLAKDIEKYGLWEYEENDDYSEEMFNYLGWKYCKVMIGKGFGTLEEFNERMEAFLSEY